MSNLRVLIVHRPPGATGGDISMAVSYGEQLAALGVDVTMAPADEAPSLPLASFDYVHLWAAVSPNWGFTVASLVKLAGTRLIITPLYWPRDERMKYYGQAPDLYLGYKGQIAATLGMADAMACITMGEVMECWRLVPGKPAYVLGCGAERPEPTALPMADAVVCIGRVERHKNQHNLARACADLGLPLVCIGALVDEGYAAEVAAWGVRLLGERSHDDTMQMLATARVHALPSFGEIVSQSTLEAAVRDVPCVIGTVGADYEFFGPGAHYCDPADWRDIAAAVKRAWDQQPRAWFTPTATWYDVAVRSLDWMVKHAL